jgi:hypothetical protein
VQDPNNALQLKSEFVTVTGLQGGYGYLSLAAASFLTSSSLETYSLGFSDLVTGTVSSFFIGRSDGVTLTAAPVYVSSLYLGNVGGTVAGQLTTDASATDLFWNGSKLNNQSGGGGGAIDYVSAFTVSTGSLEVSTISSSAIFTYGILGSALFNAGPDPMAITTIPSGTLDSVSDWTIRSGSSTIVDAVTSLYLGSSNDLRLTAPLNVYLDTPQVLTGSLTCTDTVSTLKVNTSSFNVLNAETSSILTSSISFGTAPGWVSMGAVQAIVFSSIQTNTMLGYVSSLLVGTPSTNAFQIPAFNLQLVQNSAAKPVANTWTIGSDMRIKENITDADMDRCYTDIKSVKLRRFAWRNDFYNAVQTTDRHVLGFLAQEVSTIVPKAVETKTAFGYSDFQFLNIDQLNMSLYGAVKRTIQDKEVLESTVKGQKLLIESLLGTQTFILSTLNGLQGR